MLGDANVESQNVKCKNKIRKIVNKIYKID